MTSQTTLTVLGKYEYFNLPSIQSADIKDEPGNYLFARFLGGNNWQVIYAGSTPAGGTLRGRLPDHEQIEAAKRLGATHVFAHINHDHAAMVAEEKDVIESLDPPLNVQHRTPQRAGAGLLSGTGY